MVQNSKYEQSLKDYNPEKDGTMKAYCQKHDLNYNQFKKAAYRQRIKDGHIPRKQMDYSDLCRELEESGEKIKAFCNRKNLNYDNFRMSWYRYRKRNNIAVRHRSPNKNETHKAPAE